MGLFQNFPDNRSSGNCPMDVATLDRHGNLHAFDISGRRVVVLFETHSGNVLTEYILYSSTMVQLIKRVVARVISVCHRRAISAQQCASAMV